MNSARREKILDIVRVNSQISIKLLAQKLLVSEMTVHRDLTELSDMGFVIKERGKAIAVDLNKENYAGYIYNSSNILCTDEKRLIAERAAELIGLGDSVIFDNSTSVFQVVKRIKDRDNLVVFSTNHNVTNELKDNKHIVLYSCGGLYSHRSATFVGTAAEEFVSKIHASKAFIGIYGISAEHGLTDPFPLEAALKRKIVQAADEVIVLADHMKLNRTGMERIMDLDKVTAIYTDYKADRNYVEKLRDFCEVVICGE